MTIDATVFQALGVIGFALYMLAYAGLQLERMTGDGSTYAWMNLWAAILVLVSLLDQFNLAALLIQVSWIVISIVGLTRRWRRRYA